MATYYGEHGVYCWIQTTAIYLDHLVRNVPEAFLGKYVAITAFDCGPFHPNAEERKAGWSMHENVGLSPRVTDVGILPYDNHDEWYVLEEPTWFRCEETFVKWGRFSLRDPAYLLENYDPTWDKKLMQEDIERILDQQKRLWANLERLNPETYVADGDRLIFVTRNSEIFHAVRNLCERAPAGPNHE